MVSKVGIWRLWVPTLSLVALAMLAHHSPIDRMLQAWLNASGEPWPWAGRLLSQAGLGVTLLLFVSAWQGHRPERWAAFTLALLTSGVLVQILKYTLALPRPLGLLPPDEVFVVGEVLRGRAFPSGHATAAFALLGVLLTQRWRTANEAAGQTGPALLTCALVLAFALAVGWARVAVGAHWPSDVVAGAALGLACGWTSQQTSWHTALAAWFTRSTPRRFMALLMALLGLGLAADGLRHDTTEPGLVLAGGLGLLAGWRCLQPTTALPEAWRHA